MLRVHSKAIMDCKFIEKAAGAIADKSRLSILIELRKKETLTNAEVMELVGLSQPCVSHHIKLLIDSGLVSSSKEGRNIHLQLNKEAVQQLTSFLDGLV
jgi:ArsR family transcriptional regulator